MKQYKVLNQYVSAWGEEDEIIVDTNEIERLSKEWGITVDELMEQVEEIA